MSWEKTACVCPSFNRCSLNVCCVLGTIYSQCSGLSKSHTAETLPSTYSVGVAIRVGQMDRREAKEVSKA